MPGYAASRAVFTAAAHVEEASAALAGIDLADWTGVAGQACRERLHHLNAMLAGVRDHVTTLGQVAWRHEVSVEQAKVALGGGGH